MRAVEECISCIELQAEHILDKIGISPDGSIKCLLKEVIAETRKRLNPSQPVYPAKVAETVFNELAKKLNIVDLFRAEKKNQNRIAAGILAELEEQKKRAGTDLSINETFQLMLAGNLIDHGNPENFNWTKFKSFLQQTITSAERIEKLLTGALKAKKNLIIGDNAGEIVFDAYFIKKLKETGVTADFYYAVRSAPALNDALLEDALETGINESARVIESGARCAGTILEECSADFLRIFNSADLIISKGQGNFETLENHTAKKLFFLFIIKCDIVARYLNLPQRTIIFETNINLKKRS